MEVQWQLIVQLLLVTVALATDPKCPQEHKPDSAVMYPHTADCRKFYVCLANRMLVEKECPEGHQFDAGAATCIASNATCDLNELIQKRAVTAVPRNVYCRPDLDDMLIANRADGCRSFFKCSSGTPVLTQCAGNLLFNEHTNYCDWEYNVQCDGVNYVANQAASPFKLPNCAGIADGSTYANYQTRCKSYFFCNQGVRSHIYCTDDLLYNPAMGTCDWRGNVDCACTSGECYGAPPETGSAYANSPDASDTSSSEETFDEPESERPLPTPEVRPPRPQPTARPTQTPPTRPPMTVPPTQHPGPPEPDCVDCKRGEIDRPPAQPPVITPPPPCDHCLPGQIDTTRGPIVTTPPPTTTCLDIGTRSTTTTRPTTTTRTTKTTTTRATTTTTACPTPPPCPDPKLPLCPPQPCPPTNCIAQACIPHAQPWHKSNYNGPSITLTAIREAQQHNDNQ